MSIIQQEDELKGLPDGFLAQEMENPSGQYPQFLVFTELNRRKDMRDRFAEQQAQAPTSTMAEEMVAEVSGIGQGMPPQMIPPGMEPPMDMPMQGMPPQMMRDGGVVGYSHGGIMPSEDEIQSLMSRLNVDRNRAIEIHKFQNIPSNPSRGGEIISSSPPLPTSGLVIDSRVPKEPSVLEMLGSSLDGSGVRGYFGGGLDLMKGIYTNLPYSPGYRPSRFDRSIPEEKTETVETVESETNLPKPRVQAYPLAPSNERPSFEQLQKQMMGMFDDMEGSDNTDLDAFRNIMEEYSPAPDPNVSKGRQLMAIGQGLLEKDTWQRGLAAGIENLGNVYDDDAKQQREYNRNRRAGEQAIRETMDARRRADENRQFGARRTSIDAASRLSGDYEETFRREREHEQNSLLNELSQIDETLSEIHDPKHPMLGELRERRDRIVGLLEGYRSSPQNVYVP